ncbi:MAG: hypothetical protein K2M73_04625 [Lachnospiraceae bacterium]|nr:hypothetical protein [Lachnospiraceae bacterium]
MAFIYERVKEEDRELFNSFVKSRKANKYTRWVADKERNIYFFWIGGESREYTKEYFLAWNDLKVYIYTEVKCGKEDVHIWIKRISMPKVLSNNNEKINEIVDMIPEILQMMYRSKIIFEEIVTPSFRKGDN